MSAHGALGARPFALSPLREPVARVILRRRAVTDVYSANNARDPTPGDYDAADEVLRLVIDLIEENDSRSGFEIVNDIKGATS